MYFRPVKRFGAIASAYDAEVRTMNEPARMVNAVGLPRGMAPRPTEIRVQNRVAGMGQLRRSLTLEKKVEKGVASSRASDHQIRPQVRSVPMRQMISEMRTMKSRQNVPPFVPVA